MKITTEYRQGRLTICLTGSLTITRPRVLLRPPRRDRRMPARLMFYRHGRGCLMDSSGIAVILKIYKKMKAIGGTVIIRNMGSHARKILDMSGLTRLISSEEVKA